MSRPVNQPSAYAFRSGSADRTNIHMIEGLVLYGLVTNWSRVVDADEKGSYTLWFADGTSEEGLRPNEAKWLIAGMLDAYRTMKFLGQKGA